MYRYQILIEYDGFSRIGWQIQKKGESIQKILQNVFSKVLKEKIKIYGSGRTDKNVHSMEQSAHFDLDSKIINVNSTIKTLKNKFLRNNKNTPLEFIAATRGNHGQSVATAASQKGIPSKIVVPEGNSIEKNRAMVAQGAELITYGKDFQEAFEYAVDLSKTDNLHMFPSFHPLLVRGVATYGWEVFNEIDGLDVIYVPIGLGSGVCPSRTPSGAGSCPPRQRLFDPTA